MKDFEGKKEIARATLLRIKSSIVEVEREINSLNKTILLQVKRSYQRLFQKLQK